MEIPSIVTMQILHIYQTITKQLFYRYHTVTKQFNIKLSARDHIDTT